MDTKGSESYLRINYKDLDLYIGYVYSLPQLHHEDHSTYITLTPHDKFATTCVYENESHWKFGIETSYIGQQYIDQEKKSPAYWLAALMVQKQISSFTLTANCENLFDFRQTKKEDIIIPPYSSPMIKPLWAPLDGRVVNVSVKFIF